MKGSRKKSSSAAAKKKATTKNERIKKKKREAKAPSVAATARKPGSEKKSAAGGRNGKGKKRQQPLLLSRSKKKGAAIKSGKKTALKRTATTKTPARKVVRILEHGQFRVDGKTLRRLNDIDNAIVELVSRAGAQEGEGSPSWSDDDDAEFKKKLAQLTEVVTRSGKPLGAKEIVPSDIILPDADLSIDEARKIFSGEGLIPEIYA